MRYQPFWKRESYRSWSFQYVWNIPGQGGRMARMPLSPAGSSLPSASMIPASTPGIGRPIEPGRMSIDA